MTNGDLPIRRAGRPSLALAGLSLVFAGTACALNAPGKQPRYCCGPCRNAEARQLCPWEATVGPSVGITAVDGARVRSHLGIDLSVGKDLLWGSTGTKVELGGPIITGHTYVEGGMLLFPLVVGIGGGLRAGIDGIRAGPQVFVGFPLLVAHHLYVEPYARPAFLFGGDDGGFLSVAEFGLLIKFWSHRVEYGN